MALAGLLVSGSASAQEARPSQDVVSPSSEASVADDVSRAPPPAEHRGRARSRAGADDDEEPVFTASIQDGVSARSRDDEFSLRFATILVSRLGVDVPTAGEPTPFANLHLARLILRGNAFGPHVRYFVSAELTGEPYLRDLELAFEWRPELAVRVGRFRTPFSRQFQIPRSLFQLTDRSIASDYFRAGRSNGLAIDGRLWNGRGEYHVGLYDGASSGWPSGTLLPVVRVVAAPFGELPHDETTARAPGDVRLAIGLSGYSTIATSSDVSGSAPTAGVERNAGSIDVALRAGPVGLSAEGYVDRRRYADGEEQVGAGGFVQLGVFVVPATFELAARGGWLVQDVEDLHDSAVARLDLGATYYWPAAGVKLQTAYAFTEVSGGAHEMNIVKGHNAYLQAVFAF